jgi:hypothetical protein
MAISQQPVSSEAFLRAPAAVSRCNATVAEVTCRAAANKYADIPGPRAATGSFSVSLRAEPRDLAVSVHPIVNVGLALETRNFPWFGAWVLSDHSPVIIRVTNRPEGHFCFRHAVLCRERLQKRTSPQKKVRASLKIAVTLQRHYFARTLRQVIDFAILSYFFFPHQPSLAREQGCHAEAIWRRRALDPRATARQAIRPRARSLQLSHRRVSSRSPEN